VKEKFLKGSVIAEIPPRERKIHEKGFLIARIPS
jgi:hypothetical protein